MILKTLASYIRKLKDRSGNYVLPAVRAKGVYLNNNITLQSWIDNLLKTIYPVGSIYQSMNTTSPASLFGGNWNQINGVFLLSNSSSYQVNTTGGEAYHVLTNPELPTHHHYFANTSYTLGNGGTGWEGNMNLVIGGHEDYIVCFYNGPLGRPNAAFVAAAQQDHTLGAGDNAGHNNMPPYLVCCMWRRVS